MRKQEARINKFNTHKSKSFFFLDIREHVELKIEICGHL